MTHDTAASPVSPLQADTIVALATAPGGAIGIVRLSGPKAIAITDKVFLSANGKPLADARAHTIHYGEIKDWTGSTIDDVLVSVFRAPHSYTGEDATEISCHGSAYILQQAVQALIDAGARQAEPGEYTRRAYLNGRLDLSQAEAVADLIASTNQATHRMAMSQLRGHFSSELARLREELLKLTSLLELELDFSDHEELEFADRTELEALAREIDQRVTSLAQSFKTGQALKRGIPVAIVGRTNVGKSTLLNRLVGDERAIVSDVHGTTRDVIEDTVELQGITFRFIDTAGLRQTDDVVEAIGIERTYQKLHEAAIVLWVTDQEPTEEEAEEIKQKTEGKKLIQIRNKIDKSLTPQPPLPLGRRTLARQEGEGEDMSQEVKTSTPSFTKANHSPLLGEGQGVRLSLLGEGLGVRPLGVRLLRLSAKTGLGLATLEQALVRAADLPTLSENDVIVTSARHYEALSQAHADLSRVLDGMAMGLSGDLLAEDLRAALDHLADITGGQITPQETLNNIFQHFCVGK